MASLQEKKRKNGSAFLIQFAINRERKSLFLDAKYSRDDAVEIKRVVEKCVVAIETDSPLDRRTLAWLENASDDLRTRLQACDLIEPDGAGVTFKELFDAYYKRAIARGLSRASIKFIDRFETVYFDMLDANAAVADFTRTDALNVYARINATPTWGRCSKAAFLNSFKAVFNYAVDLEYIARNPFSKLSFGSMTNKEREFYVPLDMFVQILNACKQVDTRAALCLYRIGGLRLSEAFGLTWKDVDFQNKRLTVHSPKTQRVGKPSRVVPLFPELAEVLEELRDETAPTLDDRILNISEGTIRYRVIDAIRQAGLARYPRLLQNLRSSAAIDIYRRYGEIAENEWLGHTTNVAKSNYLHVVDDDFVRATTEKRL